LVSVLEKRGYQTGIDFYNFAAENYLSIPSTTVQAFSAGDVKFASVARGYYASTPG